MVDVVGLRYVEEGRQQVEAGAKSYQRTVDQTVRSIQVASTATQQQGRSLATLVRAVQKAERDIQLLTRAQERGRITGNQFTGALNTLSSRLRGLGIENAQSEVFRYGRATQDAARATVQHTQALAAQNVVLSQTGAAVQQATRRQSRLGVAFQQAGFQVGDFAVQVQSGTNVMVALGQQLTQLVGVGAMLARSTRWIAAFSALGVIVPITTAVVGGLMRMRSAAEDNIEPAQRLLDTYRRIESLDFSGVAESARVALSEFQPLIDFLREEALASLQRDVNAVINASGIEAMVARTLGEFEGIQQRLERVQREAENAFNAEVAAQYARTIEVINGQLDETGTRLNAQQTALGMILSIGGETREEYLRQAQAALVYLETVEGLDPAMRAVLLSLIEAVDPTGAIARSLEDSSTATDDLADNLSRAVTSDFTSLNAQVQFLAQQLGISADQAAALDAALPGGTPQVGSPGLSFGMGSVDTQGLGDFGNVNLGFGNLPNNRRNVDRSGAVDVPLPGSGSGSGSGAARELVTLESIVATMTQRIERERELLALTGQAQREREIAIELQDRLTQAGQTYTEQEIAAAAQRIAASEQELDAMRQRAEQMEQLGQVIERSFSEGFMSIVDGTKTASEAFRDMARQILAELFRVYVMQQFIGSFGGGGKAGSGILGSLGGLFGLADGGVMSRGNLMPFANGAVMANLNRAPGASVVPFANGGVVNSPTLFPMAGPQTGLMGEAGPEAIMPLKRGRDGKLGVASQNMGFNVTVTMDPSTGALGAFVRNEAGQVVAQATPRIVDASKSAVIDARQRGGAMRSTFK